MEPGTRSPKEVVQEVAQGVKEVLVSEVNLAKVEMRDTVKSYGLQGAKFGVAAGLLVFGALSLLAFLVVGFGGILGNYWLSALIIGAVLCIAGGLLAYAGVRAMRQRQSVMPHLQRSIESQRSTIQGKLAEVTDITRRRQNR